MTTATIVFLFFLLCIPHKEIEDTAGGIGLFFVYAIFYIVAFPFICLKVIFEEKEYDFEDFFTPEEIIILKYVLLYLLCHKFS